MGIAARGLSPKRCAAPFPGTVCSDAAFEQQLRELFAHRSDSKVKTDMTPCKCPHRLVVRTSRCGRDNPGSTPGEDRHLLTQGKKHSKETISHMALWEEP